MKGLSSGMPSHRLCNLGFEGSRAYKDSGLKFGIYGFSMCTLRGSLLESTLRDL